LKIRDEELLKQGLEINDRLQSILVKHDAIASGSPLPVETPHREESHREDPVPQPSTPPIANDKAPDEEDDEFAQIARRYLEACKGAYTFLILFFRLQGNQNLMFHAFYIFAEKISL
jgi:hypothetical protein